MRSKAPDIEPAIRQSRISSVGMNAQKGAAEDGGGNRACLFIWPLNRLIALANFIIALLSVSTAEILQLIEEAGPGGAFLI